MSHVRILYERLLYNMLFIGQYKGHSTNRRVAVGQQQEVFHRVVGQVLAESVLAPGANQTKAQRQT